MKRIALIGMILGVLLIADGIFMVVSKYNGGETQAWNLPDGWIIIISAAILLVASLLSWLLAGRAPQKSAPAEPATLTGEVEAEQA